MLLQRAAGHHGSPQSLKPGDFKLQRFFYCGKVNNLLLQRRGGKNNKSGGKNVLKYLHSWSFRTMLLWSVLFSHTAQEIVSVDEQHFHCCGRGELCKTMPWAKSRCIFYMRTWHYHQSDVPRCFLTDSLKLFLHPPPIKTQPNYFQKEKRKKPFSLLLLISVGFVKNSSKLLSFVL